jgi:hypothetical protein
MAVNSYGVNSYFVNNTFYGNFTNQAFYIQSGAGGHTFKNNIVYNTNTGTTYAIFIGSGADVVDFNNNIFEGDGTNWFSFGGTAGNTIAAWRDSVGNHAGADSAAEYSLNSDPLLLNTATTCTIDESSPAYNAADYTLGYGANMGYWQGTTANPLSAVREVVTSINVGKDSADVTVSDSSWGWRTGYVVLDAAAPDTAKVGDILYDANETKFLIGAISSDTLWLSAFDTLTVDMIPATGAGYVDEAYNLIDTWEDSLDSDVLYIASQDSAKGELYNDGGDFDEDITLNSTSLAWIHLTAAIGERHDGTEGSGVVWDKSATATDDVLELLASGGATADYEISWFEMTGDPASFDGLIGITGGSGTVKVHHMILHDTPANTDGIQNINTFYDSCFIYNNIVYDVRVGIYLGGANWTGRIENNTIYNASNSGFFSIGNGVAARSFLNNNACFESTTDFGYTGTPGSFTNLEMDNNCSSDATADDAATGNNNLVNKIASANLADTIDVSIDLHVKDTDADIYDAGKTLTLFNIDIDAESRPQGSAWDIGADEFVAAEEEEVIPNRKKQGPIFWGYNEDLQDWEKIYLSFIKYKEDYKVKMN